ncbi:MAG: single-stranded DNA-binding protein [Carnobacterium sp.]|uniref:single-stranded DNA-binding protein n=1 Tax=Carnobacterium sp. TaxID=48221 RepID=UPI003C72E78A
MINNVVLIGRLTKELDLRYTSNNGQAVASFNIAVNRQFTNAKREREADFINCVVWRKTAENMANFTKKGSLVGLEGRIQTRSYDNQQGQKVYVTEVVVENFSLLEPRSKNTTDQSNGSNIPTGPVPANNRTQTSDAYDDPFDKSSQPIDISDDDLPF